MLSGADCSWPSAEELTKANEVRRNCLAEINALRDPTRDVVGDLRLCRFLRYYSGNVQKAIKGYKEFLTWRVRENVETLREGVVDLAPDDMIEWVDSIRSPFSPAMNFSLGESPEGHTLIFAAPGFFKAADFAKQRPSCHTMDTDLLVVWTVTEWLMKHVDDMSYAANKVLYTIKILDMKNLGKEKIPIFVSEIRNFAKNNIPPVMQMFCEHDILILIVNAPFSFRVLWAFASTLISKRQQDRVKTFSDVMAAEPQSILKAIARPEQLPTAIGGTRSEVPLCFPLAHEDPQKIKLWMSRTANAVNRGKAPYCELLQDPASRREALRPRTRMSINTDGKVAEIKANVDSSPIAERVERIPSAIQAAPDIVASQPTPPQDTLPPPDLEASPPTSVPAISATEEPAKALSPEAVAQNLSKPDVQYTDVVEEKAAPVTGCFCCASK